MEESVRIARWPTSRWPRRVGQLVERWYRLPEGGSELEEFPRREAETMTGVSVARRGETVTEEGLRFLAAFQLLQTESEGELRLGGSPGIRREEAAARCDRFLQRSESTGGVRPFESRAAEQEKGLGDARVRRRQRGAEPHELTFEKCCAACRIVEQEATHCDRKLGHVVVVEPVLHVEPGESSSVLEQSLRRRDVVFVEERQRAARPGCCRLQGDVRIAPAGALLDPLIESPSLIEPFAPLAEHLRQREPGVQVEPAP